MKLNKAIYLIRRSFYTPVTFLFFIGHGKTRHFGLRLISLWGVVAGALLLLVWSAVSISVLVGVWHQLSHVKMELLRSKEHVFELEARYGKLFDKTYVGAFEGEANDADSINLQTDPSKEPEISANITSSQPAGGSASSSASENVEEFLSRLRIARSQINSQGLKLTVENVLLSNSNISFEVHLHNTRTNNPIKGHVWAFELISQEGKTIVAGVPDSLTWNEDLLGPLNLERAISFRVGKFIAKKFNSKRQFSENPLAIVLGAHDNQRKLLILEILDLRKNQSVSSSH